MFDILNEGKIASDTYVRDPYAISTEEVSRAYFDRSEEILAALGSLPLGERDEAVAEAQVYERAGFNYL